AAEGNRTELSLAYRPPAFENVRKNRCADGSAQMMLPFAPIDARSAKRALLTFDRFDVDAAGGKEPAPRPAQFDNGTTPAQHTCRDPSIEHIDREATGEMIVAGSGMTHRLILGAGAGAHVTGARRDRDQSLDEMCHVGVRDAKMPVTAL